MTEIDYAAWDQAIQSAITALSDAQTTSRSQKFIKSFPDALTKFRQVVQAAEFKAPLEDFQLHPTYLLRYLLAEWKDEEKKIYRGDLSDIMQRSLKRIIASQAWRSGEGECWSQWGYKNMTDLYNNYKPDEAVQQWFPQRFIGRTKEGHPVHFELLPNSYQEKLILPNTLSRLVGNERTLRVRVPEINTPTTHLSDPILGCLWVIDARRLSIFNSGAIYKTATKLIEASNAITSAHYPEQGYQALVLNLGVVLGSLYNMAVGVMPATTQRSTVCYIGNDVLGTTLGWENVPLLMKDKKVTTFQESEREITQSEAS